MGAKIIVKNIKLKLLYENLFTKREFYPQSFLYNKIVAKLHNNIIFYNVLEFTYITN